MANLRTIVTAICLVAAAGLLAANVTQAQTAANDPPRSAFPQAAPSAELLKKYSAAEALGQIPRLNYKRPGGSTIHIMPKAAIAAARKAALLKLVKSSSAALPLLTYHGDRVIAYPQIYMIFWAPPALQDGSSTGYSPKYIMLQNLLGANLLGHGMLNIGTQYYQIVKTKTTYIQNDGRLAGSVIDTSPYPAAGSDCVSRTNCITDAQTQAEITKVMTAQGWTSGFNKLFMLYTSSGEITCDGGDSCSDNVYCGYHGNFGPLDAPPFYAQMPYEVAGAGCDSSGQTMPNGDLGDLVASTASHEIMESITDPYPGFGWYDDMNGEIGDICQGSFGPNTWSGPSAAGDQNWNGSVFELQQMYDDHALACASVGPQ